MKKIVAISTLLLLAACASTPKIDSSQTSQSGKESSSSIKSGSEEAASDAAKKAEIEARRLASEIGALQQNSVYFDFDKFVVNPEYLGVIEKQAAFIKAHQNDVVTVEGNADERGSAEYNLALGDRRANAAKKLLEMMWVPASQISTVSLGEEKPRLSCHEEKCWKENRRDDFFHKLN